MPSSDLPLTRRQALAAGAGGVALLFAGPLRGGAAGDVAEAASATCVMTPEKTEGPYFVDEALNRSDIRASKDGSGLQPGAPLALTMYVFDAAGEYSDVAQNGTDAMNAQVFASAPYSGRGTADTLDTGDGIYGTDGSSLLLRPASDGAGGHRTDFSVGVAGDGADSGDGDNADTAIAATLLSLRARRHRRRPGRPRPPARRRAADRPRAAVARGRTLARRSRALRAGKRTLRLPIATGTRAGGAQLTLVLTDAAGNRCVIRRTIHVPRRR